MTFSIHGRPTLLIVLDETTCMLGTNVPFPDLQTYVRRQVGLSIRAPNEFKAVSVGK